MNYAPLMGQQSGPGRALFAVFLVAGVVTAAAIHNPIPAIAGVLIGLYFLFSIKIVRQW